jgi:drug/metabolite transporter (DMT)-like permease
MSQNQTTPAAQAFAAVPGLFVVLWSTGFIAAKYAVPHATPLLFLTLRFAIAGVLMAGLAMSAKALWPDRRRAAHAILAGALLHGAYLGPIFWVISKGMPAGVVALITGLQPFMTAILSGNLLGERITVRHWVGLAIGLAGVALVVSPKLTSGFEGVTPFNVGLTMAAVAIIALGTVQQKANAGGMDLRSGAALQYLGGGLVVFIAMLVFEEPHADFSPSFWFALSWSVLVLSIGAISLLMLLLRHGSAAKVSGLIYLVPGMTALMAWVVFGEVLLPVQIMGMVVCAGGVMLVSRSPKPQS